MGLVDMWHDPNQTWHRPHVYGCTSSGFIVSNMWYDFGGFRRVWCTFLASDGWPNYAVSLSADRTVGTHFPFGFAFVPYVPPW